MAPCVAALCKLLCIFLLFAILSRSIYLVNSSIYNITVKDYDDCYDVLDYKLISPNRGLKKRHIHQRLSAPILYYANGIQTYRTNLRRGTLQKHLLLSGDIETNPGPTFHHHPTSETQQLPTFYSVNSYCSILNRAAACGLVGHLDTRLGIGRPITASMYAVGAASYRPTASTATDVGEILGCSYSSSGSGSECVGDKNENNNTRQLYPIVAYSSDFLKTLRQCNKIKPSNTILQTIRQLNINRRYRGCRGGRSIAWHNSCNLDETFQIPVRITTHLTAQLTPRTVWPELHQQQQAKSAPGAGRRSQQLAAAKQRGLQCIKRQYFTASKSISSERYKHQET
jgi:hypothetical protein